MVCVIQYKVTFASNLVAREAAVDIAFAIGPLAELLDNPCSKAGWRIVQSIGRRVGTRSLEMRIGTILIKPPGSFRQKALLGGCQRFTVRQMGSIGAGNVIEMDTDDAMGSRSNQLVCSPAG